MSLKERKAISETLRLENKKMELRLQQLKNTISREKEERLSSNNGSIWNNGGLESGLLNNKRNLSGNINNKKVKVRMLKEEKIPEPKLKTNLKMIKKFSDNLEELNGSDDSVTTINLDSVRKGNGYLKCGQCENVKAAVNCMECSEYYCSKCFAAFHLKGALRKHRCAPISATSGRRVSIPSPLFKPFVVPNTSQGTRTKGAKNSQNNESSDTFQPRPFISEQSARSHNMSSRVAAATTTVNPNNSQSQLNSDFDEEFSHQYFKEALEAWRQGTEPPNKPNTKPGLRTEEQATETVNQEDTEGKVPLNGSRNLEIQFTTGSNMSYADKLLLKKYKQQPIQQAIFGAEEMKRVLDLLSRNTETELQENKKLWETQIDSEVAELDQISNNLFTVTPNKTNSHKGYNDNTENHLNVEAICDLWDQIDQLNHTTNQTSNPVSSRQVVQFPDDYGRKAKINDNDEAQMNTINKPPTTPPKVAKPQNKSLVNHKTDVIEKIHQKEEEHTAEGNNVKTNQERPLSYRNQQKIKSARQNKTHVITKPHSARRMSARKEKGGQLTTKPSECLDILASLNQYLPYDYQSQTQHKSSPKRSASRPINSAAGSAKTKLSYAFYQHTSKSWKPNSAYRHDDEDDGISVAVDISDILNNDASWTIENDSSPNLHDAQLINEEICKLDCLRSNTRDSESRRNNDTNLNQRVYTVEPNEDVHFTPFSNDHHAAYDDDDDDELSDQFQKLQDEFSRISHNEGVNIDHDGDNDDSDGDIIADSLDFSDVYNGKSKLEKQNLDKFHTEDSFDLKLRTNSSTTDENRQLQESVDRLFNEYDDSESDEEGLTSSRFDDYQDVHELR